MDAKSKDGHSVLLHSTAHLMAQAVKRLFPTTKVTIGPYLENRFYYDFDVKTPFTEEDLVKIEEEMLNISNENKKYLLYWCRLCWRSNNVDYCSEKSRY
mgnify:CR=1 FL=1